MTRVRKRFPSRIRTEGFISIGELLGRCDEPKSPENVPGEAAQKPKAPVCQARWGRRSFVYSLSGKPTERTPWKRMISK